jgi:hypothetical protein
MPKKEMTERDSSVVAAHHYDPDKRELTIDFNNGSRHIYEEVGADKFAGFEHASSPGLFFTKNIRPNHKSRRVK